MKRYKQVIYFGAPGTGKSYLIKELLKGVNPNNIFRVTIHPEYTYSDFVGQLLPESDGSGGVKFIFKEGTFTQALKKAYSNSSIDVYLVLEELSRGNVAAIFGDIFQLLDRNQYFVSTYSIKNKNIADQITEIIGDDITLPANFNIICTVNMNDQSVFPMDTAFKRRFDWQYVSTDPIVDEDKGRNAKLNNPKIIINKDSKEKIETTWHAFYTALNNYITNKIDGLGKSEDKQIGQFFIDFEEELIKESHSTDPITSQKAIEVINEKIKHKLLLYLWQDVQGILLNRTKSLFDKEISSFDKLFNAYGVSKVFNDIFINNFMEPVKSEYPY